MKTFYLSETLNFLQSLGADKNGLETKEICDAYNKRFRKKLTVEDMANKLAKFAAINNGSIIQDREDETGKVKWFLNE